MTPLILSFSDAATLGLTLTASGTGAIFGNSALAYAFAWSVMHCVGVRVWCGVVCLCALLTHLVCGAGPSGASWVFSSAPCFRASSSPPPASSAARLQFL